MTQWGRRIEPTPVASTKLLNGFAFNLAQKFDASCDYILSMLREHGIDRFRADLLTGEIAPELLAVDRNQNLVNMVKDNYDDLIRRFPHITVTRAELTAGWLPPPPPPSNDLRWYIEVVITAADGRVWRGRIDG